VEERREGTREEKTRECSPGEEVEGKNDSGCGSPGKAKLGHP